ncbi:hypothetical protein KKA94_01685, partial [Patescibacteria group bacterium]|nr:hypothetical protein [Patescibacteria group bacterium]
MKVEDILAEDGDPSKEVENFNAHFATLKKFTDDVMAKIAEDSKYPLSEKTVKFIQHLLDGLLHADTDQATAYRQILTMLLVEIERAYFNGEYSRISDLKTRLGVTITQVVQTFRDEIHDW